MPRDRMPGEGAEPEVVFVYGALRSGTTVFRLMLDAHGGIANPGEVDFLFDHLQRDPGHPTGWRYRREALQQDRIFLAKTLVLDPARDGLDLLRDMIAQLAARRPGLLALNVHRHADRIAEVLPGARFLHMLRDPRDVARSSIGMGWAGTLYHGVDHWIASERAWDAARRVLPEAQVFEFRYEDLFDDPEGMLRRICAFLGLPYAPGMLDYHRNTTYGPPDRTLVEQWRHKSTPREIALLEGKAGALMEARGYRRNGAPAQPGAVEGLRLALANKAAIWRLGVARYGAVDFLSEKITRRLGLGRLHRQVRARIRDKSAAFLK